VVSIVLLPLLYVLSVGPVEWLVTRGYINPNSAAGEVLQGIYLPIRWLMGVSPWFKSFMTWYLRLCVLG